MIGFQHEYALSQGIERKDSFTPVDCTETEETDGADQTARLDETDGKNERGWPAIQCSIEFSLGPATGRWSSPFSRVSRMLLGAESAGVK